MAAQKHPTNRPVFADPRTLRLAPNVRVASVEPQDQEEFEASILANGVQQPLSVRMAEDGIAEVVAGSRRLAAALKTALDTVPIHWVNVADEQLRTFQLLENIQRDNGHPLDIAAAIWDMYNNEAGGSQVFIAEALGKPKSWVSKMMKLGADVPESANTVARGLMLANQLADGDMAYTLCQIEALSLPDAQRIGKEIAAYSKAALAVAKDPTEGNTAELAKCIQHTRGSLRSALKQLQTAGDDTPKAESAGNGADTGADASAVPGAPDAGEPEGCPIFLTPADCAVLSRILTSATVPAADLSTLSRLRTAVAEAASIIEAASAT